ncbi:MAG: type IV pilus secretin PilQ [bacterium]|nr:type IV pilus secretin PilQ [bacterium]
MCKRARWQLTAAVAAIFVLQLGCASSGGQGAPSPASSQPEGAVSSTQVRMPAEIRSLELEAERGAESVKLTADRPLVWTSFRNSDGDLVIELPNSVPAASVRSVERDRGLVAAVDVEKVDDAARPLTRLVVRTHEPSEHSLAGEGSLLRIQLLPVGGTLAAVETGEETGAAPPVTLAYEPLPEEEDLATGMPPLGTPEEPMMGPPPVGVAASQLFSVDVLNAGDPTVVRVAGDGEFAYSTFRLENPERFVIDLTGVVNTAGSSTLPLTKGQIDQIRIGQFKPRPDPVSRVVFDLREPLAPRIERTADGLTVTFSALTAAAAPAAGMMTDDEPAGEMQVAEVVPETVTFEEPSAAEMPPEEVAEEMPAEEPVAPQPIEEYEPFEPAADEPVVAEDLEAEPEPQPVTPQPEMVMAETPTEPEPEMPQTVTPTPVSVQPAAPPPVPVYQAPPGAPPAAEPASVSRPVGTSDVALFEAQQVQIDADPRLEEKEKFLASFGTLVITKKEEQYYGEPIDMSLRKADLVETLRSFATISDLNFVIQPGVGGSVTVELKGVPWDQAMHQILKINNLGMDIDGTIVRIAPLSQLRAEAEEQRKLRQVQQASVPLRTVLKSLSYSRAEEVAGLLRNRTGSILSNRGTVQVDKRTNTLIIRELPGSIDTVLAVIDNLDSPEPQVTIEARIIEATKSFSRSLGIAWGFNGIASNEFGNTTGLQFPNNYEVDGGVGLLTGGANGFLDLTLGNVLNTFTLDAQLIMAESEGLVNLVSAPRITTLNNTAASIQSGIQLPVQTVSNRTVSVQYVNATLQLRVTPQVTAEGTVMMDIAVKKATPQPGLAPVGATNSPISTRDAQTKVIVRDGGTAVIGGIYEVSANQNQDRLPGLANIPILGHLFKNRNRSDTNDELMIFITPRIIQM